MLAAVAFTRAFRSVHAGRRREQLAVGLLVDFKVVLIGRVPLVQMRLRPQPGEVLAVRAVRVARRDRVLRALR